MTFDEISPELNAIYKIDQHTTRYLIVQYGELFYLDESTGHLGYVGALHSWNHKSYSFTKVDKKIRLVD